MLFEGSDWKHRDSGMHGVVVGSGTGWQKMARRGVVLGDGLGSPCKAASIRRRNVRRGRVLSVRARSRMILRHWRNSRRDIASSGGVNVVQRRMVSPRMMKVRSSRAHATGVDSALVSRPTAVVLQKKIESISPAD
jgi:hypothetical protein